MTRVIATEVDVVLMREFLEDACWCPYGGGQRVLLALGRSSASERAGGRLGGRPGARALYEVCPYAAMDSAAVAGVAGGDSGKVCVDRHGANRDLR